MISNSDTHQLVTGARFGAARVPQPTGQRLTGDDAAALLRSAARGDERGWDALIGEFGRMIWAVARAHRLGEADASDVAQATWLKLLEHIEQLKDPTRIGAWLATTARRECLRVLRETHRQLPVGDSIPEQEATDPPPGDGLMLAERAEAIWRAFGRLRPGDQALLRLLTA